MAILNIKNYTNEVFNEVKEILSDSYHLNNPRYIYTNDTIKNIIKNYLCKYDFKYNTKTGITKFNNEFYCCYSYSKDIPSNIDDAIIEFIKTAACEVTNLIQNIYFNNDTLTWNFKKVV